MRSLDAIAINIYSWNKKNLPLPCEIHILLVPLFLYIHLKTLPNFSSFPIYKFPLFESTFKIKTLQKNISTLFGSFTIIPNLENSDDDVIFCKLSKKPKPSYTIKSPVFINLYFPPFFLACFKHIHIRLIIKSMFIEWIFAEMRFLIK